MRKREVHPKLWARVQNGVITRNPGPRPFRIDDVIVQEWTDQEMNKAGFQRVLVDYEDQFDPDIQSMLEPIDTLKNGQVVRTMVYEFQPSARIKMLQKINDHYNDLAKREEQITPLLLTEYREVENEARRAAKSPNPSPEDFPFLSADIGVTRKKDGTVVSSISEAAEVVRRRASELRSRLVDFRNQRLSARADIREAVSDEVAFSVYRSVIPASEFNAPWDLD